MAVGEAYYPGITAGDAAAILPDGTVETVIVPPNSFFQVFELADTANATPLVVRTESGLTDTKVPVGALPILPDVYVKSPNFAHRWVSGSLTFRRDSNDAKDKAVADAVAAAQGALAAVPAKVEEELTAAAAAGTFKGEPGKDGANVATTRAAVAGELQDPNSPSRAVLSATVVEGADTRISNTFGVLATSFGVRADGVTNDTAQMQEAIDATITQGKPLILPPGTILTGPLDLNGTGHAEPANAQWAGVTALIGAGQRRTIFKAIPGVYAAGQAVLRLKNVAGATARGFFVDSNNVADYGLDFSWIGGNGGNASIAPSPRNNYQDIWLERALVTNGLLGQQNDSKLSNIRSGPCAGSVGLSILAPGGLVTMDNVVVTQGLFEIAAQNGQLTQCAFFNGIRLAGASFNHINWGGSHIYGNPTTGITIDSTATGNATRGMVFEGAFFPTTTTVIAGRFHQGIKFIACQFNNYTNMFGAVTAASGAGSTPWFVFELCSFQGATPVGVDGQYGVDIQHCRNSAGAVIEAQSWRTYIPTWLAGSTAVTLGAGTINARYVWRGQEVHLRIEIMLAADTVIPAGAWTIGVPRQASANGRGLGTMWLFDSSAAANHIGAVRISASASVANLMHSNPAVNGGLVDAASPFAWGASDRFVIDAVYEVA